MNRPILVVVTSLFLAAGINAQRRNSELPPNTAKPWTRWWWPGSAVDKPNLTRQLEQLAAAGIGGVEITPIYGAKGYEERYIDYLSPRFMEMLDHAGREAKRLGLGLDMATGTGWPFGGPWITEPDAIARVVLKDGHLTGEPTKMMVKRAAPGNEGLVVNPYSPAALTRYLAPFDKVFQAFPRDLIRGQFHDSFEYYNAGWASDLPEIFRQMHGYDVQPFAHEIMDGKPAPAETLGRIKSDFRETISRMHLEYLRTWIAWSHQRGFIVRNQSHGAPANLLDLYAAADIPETETFGSTPFPIPGLRRHDDEIRHDQDLPEPLVSRMASSAAHVMGHSLASSESCTWLRDHWKVALAYAKPEIDRVLLDGINHIFYHGTVYSPHDAPWPGWLFYASTQFNPSNTWWDDFPALNQYVARVQSVLQGGKPDNTLLLYWPVYDLWDDPKGLVQQLTVHSVGFLLNEPVGRMAKALDSSGYSFDYISDSQLLQTKAAGNLLRTPGGTYRALIVPQSDRMPVETLRQILDLAQQGATVFMAASPQDVPGYGRLEQRRAEFHRLLRTLLFKPAAGVEVCTLGKGMVFRGEVLDGLRQQQMPREPVCETGVGYIRRATVSGHDYFFANLSARRLDDWITLGVPARTATILDPLSGNTGDAVLRQDRAGRMQVYLQLEPGESLILRTSRTARPGGNSWPYLEPAGPSLAIEGSWAIEFIKGGPNLPASLRTADLKSWTELGEEEAKRFGGTARYTIEFNLPAQKEAEWLLDLGDVRESARVRINGQKVATVWSLPFRVAVGRYLEPGRNLLELEVTNLAANRIRDLDRRGVSWKIMREINFVNIRYQPFDASGWELKPSGLLGPVRLVPMRRLNFRR